MEFNPPPPMPAITLLKTSAHRLLDAPHIADPIKNRAIENNNADRLPKVSDIRPSISIIASIRIFHIELFYLLT
jgi:hypothetical protein